MTQFTTSEACPRCTAPLPAEATRCRFCGGSLLLEVALNAPVAYARTRQKVARVLAGLGPPLRPAAQLAGVLATPRPVVVQGATLAQAARVLAELERAEIPGVVRRDRSLPVRATGYLRLVAAATSAACVMVGLWSDRNRTLEVPEIAARALPSTVSLTCGGSVGTGFFVTPELAVTNAHVVCGEGKSVEAHRITGRGWRGTLLKQDRDLDLAVVRFPDAHAVPLPMGDATALHVGEPVVMIGSPLGLAHTVHEARVSRVSRSMAGVVYVQVEANVNPGNSGGPLLDRHGRVVGVVTLMVQGARGIGLALPINYAWARSAFVPGPPERNWRGITDPALVRFDALVQDAAREDQAEVAKMAHAFARPGLVDAAAGPGGELLAVLVQRSPWMPSAVPVKLDVVRGDRTVCTSETAAEQWRRADSMQGNHSPFMRWLERHGLAEDLYVGIALVGAPCPGFDSVLGADLHLQDGDPASSQVAIERSPDD